MVASVDASAAYRGLNQPLVRDCEVLQERPESASLGHPLDIVCTVAVAPCDRLHQQCLAPRHLARVPFDRAGQDLESRQPEQW